MKISIIYFLTITMLMSCFPGKSLLIENNLADFEKLKLADAINLEKDENAEDITPSHLIGIGEGIYPNDRNFKLVTPKTFKRKEGHYFEIETEYFYTAIDSSIKVILYQWDKSSNDSQKSLKKKIKIFQNKFNELEKQLTDQLGTPIKVNIEQNITTDDSFRDDIKWKSSDGLNAYLFMFGTKNGFRQIRLAIYGE